MEYSQEESFYKKYTSMNEGSFRILSCETRQFKNDIISHIKKKLAQNDKLPQSVLQSVDYLFKLLRKVILKTYKTVIDTYLSDDQLKKEQLISRIIQQFVLSRKSPLHFLLNPAIEAFYQNNIFRTYTIEPTLSQSLLPLKYDNKSLFLSRSQDTSGLLTIEEEEEDGTNRKEIMSAILKSESAIKVPYSQTFAVIKRIMRTNKFWKKLNLLEKLDDIIIQIYLFHRSNSQVNKLYDTISAEDSKTEILLFILYKFNQTQNKSNIEKALFLPLNFMQDYDGIVHRDVKYVYTQSFIRFYSILEMLLKSEI